MIAALAAQVFIWAGSFCLNNEGQSYFAARAEEEIAAAQAATSPEAVKSHYHLAGLYLDLAFKRGANDEEAVAA